jgi:hypothetical protein
MRRTYNEIRRMIEQALLQTHTARSVVRKSMIRPGNEAIPGDAGEYPMNLANQYSIVRDAQFGTIVPYSASGSLQRFPSGAGHFERYGDWDGAESIRFLLTVTKAAGAGVHLRIDLWQNMDDGANIQSLTFDGGQFSVPVDTVGLQITDWKSIDWADDPAGNRYADSDVYLINPTGQAGTVGVGLAQVQIRGEI